MYGERIQPRSAKGKTIEEIRSSRTTHSFGGQTFSSIRPFENGSLHTCFALIFSRKSPLTEVTVDLGACEQRILHLKHEKEDTGGIGCGCALFVLGFSPDRGIFGSVAHECDLIAFMSKSRTYECVTSISVSWHYEMD